jgi:hypothetical protein
MPVSEKPRGVGLAEDVEVKYRVHRRILIGHAELNHAKIATTAQFHSKLRVSHVPGQGVMLGIVTR